MSADSTIDIRAARQRDAMALTGDIETRAMEQLCDNGSDALGIDTFAFDVEDAASTEASDDAWPIIFVRRSDGARFSVEVMATVHPLGALVDEQQPGPDGMRRKYGPVRPASRLLDLRDDEPPCVKCGVLLVAGWVDFPAEPSAPRGARVHADCEHLARMRGSRPEWFTDTADQTALPIDIAAGAS